MEPLHPPYEGSEFPRLVGLLGEEECSLDALLESEPELSVSEQELVEQEEAWRLLCSWCVPACESHSGFAASYSLLSCLFVQSRLCLGPKVPGGGSLVLGLGLRY